jgi:hypothetical protein
MDRSILRLPDPDAQLRNGERRRSVRQKLHTPVYVSFNTPQSGAVVDLSELVDLHENGFAVQTARPSAPQNTGLQNTGLQNTGLQNTDLQSNDLQSADPQTSHHLEVNRAVTLCLDLPETRQFVHGSGQVMWTDDTGRAGIRFSFLSDSSRHVLKEWLFANLLVASTNYSARSKQLARQQEEFRASELLAARRFTSEDSAADLLAPEPQAEPAQAPIPELANDSDAEDSARARLLSALDDVRRQMREIQAGAIDGDIRANSAAVLRFITERAVIFTGASGAALALLTDDRIVCRASVGEPAPPVGSEVEAQSGLSGECLRNGILVSCADTESDPRVDPEVCRMFGIGSFMAAPIFADFRAVGLIEIFSPYPHTFGEPHETVLERLAELVPCAKDEPANKSKVVAQKVEAQEELREDARAEVREGKDEQVNEQENKREAANNDVAVLPPQIASPKQAAAKENVETEPEEIRRKAAERNAVLEQILKQTSDEPPERSSEPSSERLSEEDFEEVTEASLSPARRFPFSHLALLVLTIAVAAMVLGYLLAPTIEAFWLRRAQAAQRSSAPAASSSSRQSAAASHPSTLSLSPAELRQLADRGNPDAEWQLGVLYHDGDGVPKDDALAVQWFERAAEQGYVRAQSTLGAYYWAGRGVPQDFSKAYFWSQLALAQGDENSKSRLEGLSAQMTQTQVAAARQQAEAWLHAHDQTANSKPN